MQTLRYTPIPPLNAFIDCFWYSRGYVPQRRRERSLPSGRADLVFNLHEDRIRMFNSADDAVGVTTRGAVVHGPQSRYFVLDARRDVHVIGVHFLPGGGNLLGVPLKGLCDRHVAFEDLWGERAVRLRERLVDAIEPRRMFAILEQEFLMQLRRPPLVHPVISFALRRFDSAAFNGRIEPVRNETGYSDRRFTGLFSDTVGLTPKRYARVLRLSRVVSDIAQGRKPVASIALDAGYYDQAHLTHDFRELAGTSPGDYRPLDDRSSLHAEVDD